MNPFNLQMIIDILMSSNINIRGLLLVSFTTAHDENTYGDKSSELNNNERKDNSRNIQKLLPNQVFKFGKTSLNEEVIGGNGLSRLGRAKVGGHGGERTGGHTMLLQSAHCDER